MDIDIDRKIERKKWQLFNASFIFASSKESWLWLYWQAQRLMWHTAAAENAKLRTEDRQMVMTLSASCKRTLKKKHKEFMCAIHQ